MAETKTILVAGATGQQGGAVARSLVGRGHEVRGLTRKADKIKDLSAIGVEGIRGDLADGGSIQAALRGADGFFIVTTPFGEDFSVDTSREARLGAAAVDAAKAAAVPHVVLSSVASADEDTGIPHFESKAREEQYLKGSGLRYTIARPVSFMSNFTSPWMPWMASAMRTGIVALPMPPEMRQQIVAVRDIGEIVARAFERPDAAAGKTVELAGDTLTNADLASRLSRKLGRPVEYVELTDEEAMQGTGGDLIPLYAWFRTKGFHVDIDALEKAWGYRMTRFDEYLATFDLVPGAGGIPSPVAGGA
ncbi:MAG TPA: NmrA/HSCARG family protein [Thermoplasmata archaeon]